MLPFSKGGSSQLELEPFQEGTLGTSQEKQCCPGFVSACSNFSIQYNYTSARTDRVTACSLGTFGHFKQGIIRNAT
eukprot:g686.t1